jgi:tetratricopeptide (TPR) repeat protein
MDYMGLACLLDDVDREHSDNRRRMLLDAVRDNLGAPWVDEVLHARARALCERQGLACPPRKEARLGIGETWLLLAGAEGRGHVVRLAAGGPGTDPGRAAQDEGRRALHGLRAAIADRKRRLPSHVSALDLHVTGSPSQLKITGSSLGLSTAVATMSRALGKAPPSHVAGSAVVLSDGQLGRVSFLAEKVQALRASWPEVTMLVVAEQQDSVPNIDGALRIVGAPDLAAACALFGLPVDDLPACRLEERRRMLAGLHNEEHKPHPAAQWLALSADAWEIAQALRSDTAAVSEATDALLLAAIFASHAGDGGLSRQILEQATEAAVRSRPALRIRKLVYEATGSIDDDAVAAERIAAEAVELCATLSDDDRVPLIGQAIGTRGRALLHQGRLEDAEPLLRRALDLHRSDLEKEWPRSACYLAACLRHAGRAAEALQLSRDALVATHRHAEQWELADTTALYLHMERGRALASLGHLEDAVRALEQVVRGQDQPVAYPRLGAHRSLADVLARLGRLDHAREHLQICVTIASAPAGQTLRRVGGVAAAEALRSTRPLLPASRLEGAWAACFPASVDRDHVLRTWIY